MKGDQLKKKWADLVARAWADEKFKKELVTNPTKVFKENGINMSGMDCQVVENTKNKSYFVLPMKPEGNLSEKELQKIAAAGTSGLCLD